MDRRTNARQAWYLASYEVAGVGYEFLDRYMARVRQVTAADVQRVAQRTSRASAPSSSSRCPSDGRSPRV